MRSREAIKYEIVTSIPEEKIVEQITLELLLDIRELLMNKKNDEK